MFYRDRIEALENNLGTLDMKVDLVIRELRGSNKLLQEKIEILEKENKSIDKRITLMGEGINFVRDTLKALMEHLKVWSYSPAKKMVVVEKGKKK